MPKIEYKTDHAAIAFIKNNIFPILVLIFGLAGLYSLTQTLPLKNEIELNKQAILGVSNHIDNVEASSARKDVLEAQIEALSQKMDLVDESNSKKIDALEKSEQQRYEILLQAIKNSN